MGFVMNKIIANQMCISTKNQNTNHRNNSKYIPIDLSHNNSK